MTMKHVHREPLTSDVVFKAVFGSDTPESKAALIELLNLVLDRNNDPIIDLTYLNPFSIAEAEKEKRIIMDIKVSTKNGELIDIEMQVETTDCYVNRTLYYGCKQLTKGLVRGEDYDKMKKSIVISFIKTKLFPSTIPIHSVFTLREDTIHSQLSDFLELHYIELGKIDLRKKSLAQLSAIEQLGAYIRCSGDDRETVFVETLVQKGEKVISMADAVLRKVSEEERLQILREDRETAQIFERMEKVQARDQGRKEGREEGLKQGMYTAIVNLMDKKGWTAVEAMDALMIPEDERKAYLDRL